MEMILIPNLPKKPIPTVEHGMGCLQTTISCLSERPSDAQITNLMGFKSKNRALNLSFDDHFHDFPYEIVIVYGYPLSSETPEISRNQGPPGAMPLPPDAPPGHLAHQRVRWRMVADGDTSSFFCFFSDDYGGKIGHYIMNNDI